MHAFIEKGAWLSANAKEKIKNLGDSSEVKSILILRHAAMGDMIHTRPFLLELRRCFSKAKIILGLVSHYQYFAPTDLVDEVIVTPGSDQRHLPFLTKLTSLCSFPAVDLLIDLADTPRSLLITWMTKAKVKMGFPYRQRFPLYDVVIYRSDMRFEAENLLEFLWFFGHAPQLPLNYSWDSKWPKHYSLVKNDDSNSKQQVLCFFGVSTPKRAYPRHYWKQLLIMMLKNHQTVSVLVVKGKQAWEDLEGLIPEIQQEHPEFKHRLQSLPSMEMVELAKIMCESLCFISNDTGPRHLALSLGVPCASFFHITCPGRNFPYAAENAHQHILIAACNGAHLPPELAFEKVCKLIGLNDPAPH